MEKIMKACITITGADILEFPGQITPPDHPIFFEGEIGHVSTDHLAQTEGKRLWLAMHGETPEQVYYRAEYPKEDEG